MKTNDQQFEHHTSAGNTMSMLAGFVVGGVAGAGVALLLAPQSGKETRAQIQHKTVELRDRAAEKVEGALTQVKTKTHEITEDVRGKAEELRGKAEDLQHQGQEMLVEQLDRVSAAAEAGKAAIQHPQPEKAVGGAR